VSSHDCMRNVVREDLISGDTRTIYFISLGFWGGWCMSLDWWRHLSIRRYTASVRPWKLKPNKETELSIVYFSKIYIT
jgi:hypothetical protein